jgi:hypothetical protein
MISKCRREYGLLLWAAFMLVGCVEQPVNTDQVLRSTNSHPSTPLILETKTSKTPTQTTLVTNPLSTQTSQPTFTLVEQKAYILESIRTNGNCHLPCLLGIIPGVTTWETTKNFILSTGVEYSNDVKGDEIQHWTGFDTKELQISMSIEFVEINGTIDYITAGMGDLNDARMAEVDWTPYKLSTILSILGSPSRILFDVFQPIGPSDTTGFDLWLIYDSSGIIIKYAGGPVKVEPTVRVCPNSSTGNDISGFVVFLKSSNITQWPKDVTDMMSTSPSIEKVTDYTIQKFYQTFIQDSTQECLIKR